MSTNIEWMANLSNNCWLYIGTYMYMYTKYVVEIQTPQNTSASRNKMNANYSIWTKQNKTDPEYRKKSCCCKWFSFWRSRIAKRIQLHSPNCIVALRSKRPTNYKWKISLKMTQCVHNIFFCYVFHRLCHSLYMYTVSAPVVIPWNANNVICIWLKQIVFEAKRL